MLTNLQENWRDSLWVNYTRITHTYDANSNMLTQLWESWPNNAWVNEFWDTTSYGSNNNILMHIAQNWTNNAWVNNNKQIYTYDINGNASKLEYFSWVSNQWVSSIGDLKLILNGGKINLIYAGSIVILQYLATGINDQNLTAKTFSLRQNYPNPFNPSTTISYSIAKAGEVKLNVYDIIGNKVASVVNENKPAGSYSIQFNAAALPSGIYLYRLESQGYSDTKKFILLK
jgi:hypothetical protein